MSDIEHWKSQWKQRLAQPLGQFVLWAWWIFIGCQLFLFLSYLDLIATTLMNFGIPPISFPVVVLALLSRGFDLLIGWLLFAIARQVLDTSSTDRRLGSHTALGS
jgi:hypothetical protein